MPALFQNRNFKAVVKLFPSYTSSKINFESLLYFLHPFCTCAHCICNILHDKKHANTISEVKSIIAI